MINSKFLNTITKNELYIYAVVFAILCPRGPIELSSLYKYAFTLLTWSFVLVVWVRFFSRFIVDKKIINKEYLPFLLYFAFAIVISLTVKRSLSGGLQQLFAYPTFFLFVCQEMKRNSKTVINAFANVLVLLLILNPILSKLIFERVLFHISFVGHVQMVSQFGIIAIYIGTIGYIFELFSKRKTCFLVFLALVNMITTDASSAILSALILIAAFVVYIFKLYNLFCFRSQLYVGIMFAFSLFIVFAASKNLLVGLVSDYTFSGRSFIWREVLEKFSLSPIYGYGIEGVLIKPFWIDKNGGFNYAHNQIMQNILDGGIVLLVFFWMMILSVSHSINRMNNKRLVIVSNAILICVLFIMIFDSVSLYCYSYVLFAIIMNLKFLPLNGGVNCESNKKCTFFC
ncbi:MAG: O-antigen ligase family protein [Oscillospiraceae bacterium]|nr:O-antigen ligase family protein [Oscillospiraceae bacterium]